MIGQVNLVLEITKQILSNSFPRFSIIVGERGSEKLEITRYIATKLNLFHHVLVDNKIDTVRDIIEQAYKTTMPMMYVIDNADDMSVAARNAMLKVIEEVPKNAYFVMLLENEFNTLETIRSRGVLYKMQNYSTDELVEYCSNTNKQPNDFAIAICDTPGELDLLYEVDIEAFKKYVELVKDNIATVSGANAFKIADKVALKDDAEGYDLKLFWKAFVKLCADDSIAVSMEAIHITDKMLMQLQIKGINRQLLMDKWILDIRKAWM